jgi:hypothetical protein
VHAALGGAQHVWGAPGRERRLDLARDLPLRLEDQLDLCAGLGLKGCDQLAGRLILLGVKALLPPDDEVAAQAAGGAIMSAAARRMARALTKDAFLT